MINKIFITLAIIACTASTSFAATGCPEESSIDKTKQEYIDKVIDIYDTAVGDPSDSRAFSNCLSGVEGLGDIFSMGISLPDVDGLLDKLCDTADSYLQDAINQAKDKITDIKDEITEDPVFKVVMNPDDLVNDLLGDLK